MTRPAGDEEQAEPEGEPMLAGQARSGFVPLMQAFQSRRSVVRHGKSSVVGKGVRQCECLMWWRAPVCGVGDVRRRLRSTHTRMTATRRRPASISMPRQLATHPLGAARARARAPDVGHWYAPETAARTVDKCSLSAGQGVGAAFRFGSIPDGPVPVRTGRTRAGTSSPSPSNARTRRSGRCDKAKTDVFSSGAASRPPPICPNEAQGSRTDERLAIARRSRPDKIAIVPTVTAGKVVHDATIYSAKIESGSSAASLKSFRRPRESAWQCMPTGRYGLFLLVRLDVGSLASEAKC